MNRKTRKTSLTKVKVHRIKDIRRDDNMELKVYATPTLYGEEAKKVLEEMQKQPSEKAIENGKKLIAYFNKLL